MPVTVTEKWDSREQSAGDQPSVDRRFLVVGTADDIAAHSELLAQTPVIYAGLIRQSTHLERIAEEAWEGSVRYGRYEPPQTGDSAYSFADWNCHGAGLHASPPGASLGVHLDSDHHPITGWQRACNAILFVNSRWSPEWGGDLELWNADGTECLKRISPQFNRLVLFEPSDIAFHAVARNSGPETRKTLATFYWRKASGDTGERPRAAFVNAPRGGASR